MSEMCEAKMRCGGCGSKVGSSVLSRVLAQLDGGVRSAGRKNVLVGLDQPDDCAVLTVGKDNLVVETVDFFRAFWRDEYLFAKIAVNHSLSDVHAMGMSPSAAMCIAQVPFAPALKMEQNLARLMRGTVDQLSSEDCALVGGHTCEGKDLALGFSVTALGEKSNDRILRKGGMAIGDIIILTKPIGTGVIMAANMRLLAKGAWVYAALQHMQVSNQAAGKCLVKYGATACTDVTGFGLAGHLVEMLRACAIRCTGFVELDKIPLLDGALACVVEKKVLSSLYRDNVRAARVIQNAESFSKTNPRFPLLFDPQTSGGLLATVPASQVEACLKELREVHGYATAACIGVIRARGDEDYFIELS
jgi:selenide,water dikinase